MLNKKSCRFCGQRLTSLDKHSALRKPPWNQVVMERSGRNSPPHKRSKITLLNSWRTDDSLPVFTLVTPDSYCDSYNSRVKGRVKVFF